MVEALTARGVKVKWSFAPSLTDHPGVISLQNSGIGIRDARRVLDRLKVTNRAPYALPRFQKYGEPNEIKAHRNDWRGRSALTSGMGAHRMVLNRDESAIPDYARGVEHARPSISLMQRLLGALRDNVHRQIGVPRESGQRQMPPIRHNGGAQIWERPDGKKGAGHPIDSAGVLLRPFGQRETSLSAVVNSASHHQARSPQYVVPNLGTKRYSETILNYRGGRSSIASPNEKHGISRNINHSGPGVRPNTKSLTMGLDTFGNYYEAANGALDPIKKRLGMRAQLDSNSEALGVSLVAIAPAASFFHRLGGGSGFYNAASQAADVVVGSNISGERVVSGPKHESHGASAESPAMLISGDVYIDGAVMGKWMSRNLTQQARRPSSSGSAFDPGRNPLPAGRMIGG